MTKVQVDSNGKVILLGGKALVAPAASEAVVNFLYKLLIMTAQY